MILCLCYHANSCYHHHLAPLLDSVDTISRFSSSELWRFFPSLQSPPGSPTLLVTQRAPQRWSHQQHCEQQQQRSLPRSSTLPVETSRRLIHAPRAEGLTSLRVGKWIIRGEGMISPGSAAWPIWDLAAPHQHRTLIHESHAERSTIVSVAGVCRRNIN